MSYYNGYADGQSVGYERGYSHGRAVGLSTGRHQRNDELAPVIAEQKATIAALQQSVNDLTAQLTANRPEVFITYPVKQRTFAKPLAIGDIVKSTNPGDGKRYIIKALSETSALLIGHRTGHSYNWYDLANLELV